MVAGTLHCHLRQSVAAGMHTDNHEGSQPPEKVVAVVAGVIFRQDKQGFHKGSGFPVPVTVCQENQKNCQEGKGQPF